jgi:hypothetical protein
MDENLSQAGRAFGDAFGSRAADAGEQAAGPVTQAFRDIRASIERGRNASDEATKTTVTPKTDGAAVKVDAAKLVQGLDIRSTAGVNEMLRLMQKEPGPSSLEKDTNETLHEIADNTADIGLDLVEMEF